MHTRLDRTWRHLLPGGLLLFSDQEQPIGHPGNYLGERYFYDLDIEGNWLPAFSVNKEQISPFYTLAKLVDQKLAELQISYNLAAVLRSTTVSPYLAFFRNLSAGEYQMGEVQARSCTVWGTGCSTPMVLAVVGGAIPNCLA